MDLSELVAGAAVQAVDRATLGEVARLMDAEGSG